jgi:NNP family nitrate/nitrite transporter-like MFS transporter
MQRPHMAAFHCAWWAFFVAFFNWFAITPLLGQITKDLSLTKQQLWTSSIAGVGGTILCRLLLGPLCDVYGARVLFAIVLCAASIPTACTGLIQSAQGLTLLRLFIGIAGGTFVMYVLKRVLTKVSANFLELTHFIPLLNGRCQYWTSRMFTKEVVGTANGLAAGWGNLGGVRQCACLVARDFTFELILMLL